MGPARSREAVVSVAVSTIEYPPPLGKYHFSGHRKCNYSVGVDGDALCPKCRRRITMGVEQRLEDLVCAQVSLKEQYMVPLKKLIALRGEGAYTDDDVASIYASLLTYSPEIDLLTKKNIYNLQLDPRLCEIIQLVRDQQIGIIPGFDGRAGKLVNLRRLMWGKMNMADNLFQSDRDHKGAWQDAERISEIMKSGTMTITQKEYDELLQRGMPEPV